MLLKQITDLRIKNSIRIKNTKMHNINCQTHHIKLVKLLPS